MPAQVISGDISSKDPLSFATALKQAGITRIDTAARYTNGESEKKIGQSKLSNDFIIDTKILTDKGPGDLKPDLIEKSLSNSLQVLGMEKVNVLYCHWPDFDTPIAEQAKAFDEQYKKGRFSYLGVSNFPPSMLQQWLDIAEREGYVQPTVYEGQYNLLCRGYEETLFPLLRKHSIAFTAFSPLAGGFLVGNLSAEGVQGGSRFAASQQYRGWYDKESMHEALERVRKIGEEVGVGADELSLRWLVYHSILRDEDAVILGSSKVQQIERNVEQIKKGPLDEKVVRVLDGLWELVRGDAVGLVDHEDPRGKA